MLENFIKFGYDVLNYLDWEKINAISSISLPAVKKVIAGVQKKYSQHKIKGKAIMFNSEQEFWASILSSQFYGASPANIHKIHDTQLVQLNNFTISEWIPWSSGRYWTQDGFRYRTKSYMHKESEKNGLIIFTPTGKSCATLGGLGTLRFDKIVIDNMEYKLLSATSSSYVERGIPILMQYDIFKKIRSQISNCSTIKANILGIYSRIPRQILPIMQYYRNIDKCIIKIDDTVDINNLCENMNEGNKVYITPWTIFAHRNNEKNPFSYDSCFYSNVDSSDEAAIIKAAEWIEDDYVNSHNGKILTEFDEYTDRFSKIIKGFAY